MDIQYNDGLVATGKEQLISREERIRLITPLTALVLVVVREGGFCTWRRLIGHLST